MLFRLRHVVALAVAAVVCGTSIRCATGRRAEAGVAPVAAGVPEPPAAERWPVADLPRRMFLDGVRPPLVAVSFPLRPVPTADPLVWRYHPASPPVVPHAYELRFAAPPRWPERPPFTVTGRPDFDPDGRRRPSGVPGAVVLEGAETR